MAKTFGGGGFTMTLRGADAVENLLGEIRSEFDGDAVYVVGPTVEYAVYHEFGTYKMAARPFMRPAMDKVRSNMAGEVQRMASSQGIPLDSEEAVVRCAALAVETHAKRIAHAKDIRETGALINSIEARRVR